MEILCLPNNMREVGKLSVIGILTGRKRNAFEGCSLEGDPHPLLKESIFILYLPSFVQCLIGRMDLVCYSRD